LKSMDGGDMPLQSAEPAHLPCGINYFQYTIVTLVLSSDICQ
jgi:hypothetical protein